MKTTILSLLILSSVLIQAAEVKTKGTAQSVPVFAGLSEKTWPSMTEKQRIKHGLWSRREWNSVKPEIKGTRDYRLRVKKAFGSHLLPKPATLADIHCYRIVNKLGFPVPFNLKYCVSNRLRDDIVDIRQPMFPPPSPVQASPTINEKMVMASKAAAMSPTVVTGNQSATPMQYAPGAVVTKMYFTNHPTMGRRVYVYADHLAGERWSIEASSGFYGNSLLWFTPPSYEDTGTRVWALLPVHTHAMFFKVRKR